MTISVEQHRSTTGHYQNTTVSKKKLNKEGSKEKIEVNSEHDIIFIDNKLNLVANACDLPSAYISTPLARQYYPVANTLFMLMLLSQAKQPVTENIQGQVQEITPSSSPPNFGISQLIDHVSAPLRSGITALSDVITRYDPLKFPVAAGSIIPTINTSSSESRIAFLSPSNSKKFLVELIDWDPERKVGGKTVIPFSFVTPSVSGKRRTLRRLMSNAIAEINTSEAEYFKHHCNVRTKTISGNLIGDGFLVASEYVRNPIRGLYEKARTVLYPENEMTELETTVTEVANLGSDIVVGYYTAGTAPIMKYASAQTLKVIGHAINGEGKCVLNDFSPKEMANMLFNTEVGITNRGVIPNIAQDTIPIELDDVVMFQPEGIFIQESLPRRINTEKHLIVKYNNKDYVVQNKENNQLWAMELSSVHAEQRSLRVYFDKNENKIHFDSAMPAGKGVDYEVIDGNHFVNIYGRTCQFIYKPDLKSPYVVLDKTNGESVIIPVYQERISGQWHLAINNGHRIFDDEHIAIISNLRVPFSNNFNYISHENINPNIFGNGKIYSVSNVIDSTDYTLYSVVEMKGELLPVRLIPAIKHGVRYEVYDIKQPTKNGVMIEWDGLRWVFEKNTSPFVSKNLKDSITSESYAEHVDTYNLSYPDQRGLRWDGKDNAYIKINANYVQLKKIDDYKYKVIGGGDIGYLHYKNNKFYGETFLDRLEILLSSGLSGRGGKNFLQGETLPYDKNCVAMALSKVFRVNMYHTIEKLKLNGAITTPTTLENSNTIITVMQRVDMPKVASNTPYSELKSMASGLPDGRYFAINSKAYSFEDNKSSHAFAIILNKGSVGIAGNNAESPGRSYNSIITDSDLMSMWGPYPE